MTLRQRMVYQADHEALRESVARFLATDGDFFHEAVRYGFLGLVEAGDARFAAVVLEEAMSAGRPEVALGAAMHDSFALPLLAGIGTPRLAAVVDAPGVRAEGDGVTWTLRGTADCVVNGLGAELFVVRVPADDGSELLFAVPGGLVQRTSAEPIFGLDGLDVADLRFDETPAAGRLSTSFESARAQHQLALAVAAVAGARHALRITVEYVRERKAFGAPIASFGNTRHALGALGARLTAVQTFVDACLLVEPSPAAAAAARLTATELLGDAVDLGVQLHGGYGYMWEYPIARAYAAARFFRVHGGTGEYLDEVLAIGIGL